MTDPRRRAALSRDRVVDTALALADREGLPALSIRRLAAEIGAPPMSLYAHFASKEQLQDLMFDRVVQRLFPAHGGATWQHEFETAGRHARSVLLTHPNWLPLLTRPVLPTSSLGFYDHLLRLMSEDGFGWEAAMHAFSSAMSFALGFVLAERMMTPHPEAVVPVQRLALLKEAIPRLPEGTYPSIASARSSFERWSMDRVFELGLHSLVTGIEVDYVPSRPRGKPRRRSA